MEFYFRKDGQTIGPVSIFRVRELLEDGGLTPEHQGWHEGMEEWKPCKDIPALDGLIDPNKSKEEGDLLSEDADFLPDEYYNGPVMTLEGVENEVPHRVPASLQLAHARMVMQARQGQAWRRFFARWIDQLLCWIILTPLAVWLGWVELGELALPRLIVLLFPPLAWIPIETFCLRYWGRTPGKFLLGLHVSTKEDGPLSWRQAWSRSFDVWFGGCGVELPLLAPFLKFLSLVRYRQLGETAWDAALDLKVTFRPLFRLSIACGVILAGLGFALRIYAFYEAPLPSHLDAEERKTYEMLRQGAERSAPPKVALTEGASSITP